MDPKPPTGPLVPPSFVTAASASTSRPPPLPPTLARAPAGSSRRLPSGRLIRGASAGVGGGGRSSRSSRSSGGGPGGSAPRGADGRLPQPIAELRTAGSSGVLQAPAQVAQLDSRARAGVGVGVG